MFTNAPPLNSGHLVTGHGASRVDIERTIELYRDNAKKSSDPAVQLEDADWSDNSTSNLHEALQGLDERSRDILYQRWLAEEKATLHELADKYSVSAERIRQLEKNAMNKVKALIAA